MISVNIEPDGIKFDCLELLDLDDDGDLDIMIGKERHAQKGLDIIGYENPYHTRP